MVDIVPLLLLQCVVGSAGGFLSGIPSSFVASSVGTATAIPHAFIEVSTPPHRISGRHLIHTRRLRMTPRDVSVPPSSPLPVTPMLFSSSSSSLDVKKDGFDSLVSGSDIRATFSPTWEEDPRTCGPGAAPVLTPALSYLLGKSLAAVLLDRSESGAAPDASACIGRDPRTHGELLARAMAAGLRDGGAERVCDTGIASTPAIFDFCRSGKVSCGIMITASHLPPDRNGFKIYTPDGLLGKEELNGMIDGVRVMYENSDTLIPEEWDEKGVETVDFMSDYIFTLENSLMKEIAKCTGADECEVDFFTPLQGTKVVVNAGNGSAGFFATKLAELGADITGSIGIDPDGRFPHGVPNPEDNEMVLRTTEACERERADLGIMFDTDGDRAGFVVAARDGSYEPLNRNRLIALLAVILNEDYPGCAVVTDSVTSEGLTDFLVEVAGVQHVRFKRGYSKVINRAKDLVADGVDAQMAIETSGHCAMAENAFMDDGTYTAVKIIGQLARIQKEFGAPSLLDGIMGLEEMDEVVEFRLPALDQSVTTAGGAFQEIYETMTDIIVGTQLFTEHGWDLDSDNMEGVRVRVGVDGAFFMIRPSLHDPLLSVQVEATNRGHAVGSIVTPLVELIERSNFVSKNLDYGKLVDYIG
uniref:Uncharacterized protein n=1 Tax=Corethron hystrix TaxID=216773 RepID=A0A7S1BN56_9STRA|mmetsp:Transcript_33238/g.76703  ORF Transcript_33238/g.76703 Transcript_33238/m.76703 type:complete len:643 (+) Transcript_33238:324-2252(+)